MHNGLLRMGEDKMSKSLGNLITIRDALKKYSADAIRIFILSSFYRTPLTYSEEAIRAAQGGAERLLRVTARENPGGRGSELDAKSYRDRFVEAMDDDFNTPQALAALFDLARDINRAEEEGMNAAKARRTLRELGEVLGLTFKETSTAVEPELEARVNRLIEARAAARKAKDWQCADKIREEIVALGITLEDTPQGTVWKRKR
jgi:cysteinyl-tRNA synthetase